MRLETERVALRDLVEGDWIALHAIESDPDVNRYEAYDAFDEAKAREYIARAIADATIEPRMVWQFAITRRGDDRLLGRCGFRRTASEPRIAELWVGLDPREHGAGLATEAVRRMITFAFDDLGLHRVYGDCDPRNTASARLMERLGMRREAHHVQNLYCKGEWCDSLIYAVLASEWSR